MLFLILVGVILAAGKGKRFKSDIPKVLHSIYDKPILEYVLDNFKDIKVTKVVVVVGSGYKTVSEYLKKYQNTNNKMQIEIVKQKKQLGSGDALKVAIKDLLRFRNFDGDIVVVNGDMPFLSLNSLKRVIQTHKKADTTFLTALLRNPFGYGRVIRELNGNKFLPKRIVEEKDCTYEQKQINEVNAGVYCLKLKKAKKWLNQIKNSNKQKEYYLTDLIEIASKDQGKIKTYTTNNVEETQGINSRYDLEKAFYNMNQKIIKKFQDKGITILDPRNTYIGPQVKIGKDNVIYPNTFLNGKIKIGPKNTLGPNLHVEGKVLIGKENNISYSHITNSIIGNNNLIGPYARLRDNVVLKNNVKVGNFVEMKNSKVDNDSQIAHLSYIGDAVLGKNVNIGAGTITANYNSKTGKKNKTVLKDRASTGSNSVLVAPVTINENAMVAAGSVITKNVPKDALAITRSKQENKVGWMKKRA